MQRPSLADPGPHVDHHGHEHHRPDDDLQQSGPPQDDGLEPERIEEDVEHGLCNQTAGIPDRSTKHDTPATQPAAYYINLLLHIAFS